MRKSQTGVALPVIRSNNKFSNASFNKGRLKSVFVERVKQEVSEDNDDYEAMANSQLGEQQKKLKQLLREFNEKSHFILSSFIEGQPRVTKSQTQRSSAQDMQVKEKEIANRQKLLQVCQIELKNMQARCDNLKYMTRQQMQRQIIDINKEIESLRVSNKELSRGITLNGLNICRGEKSTEVKDIQYEKLQLEMKKSQLQASTEEVIKQTEAIKEKQSIADKQLIAYENEYKVALDHESVLTLSQKLKEQVKDKKKHIQSLKQRNEQHSSGLKQKYFIKLRQLDQMNSNNKKSTDQLTKKQTMVENSKRELIILEHQLSALKKGTYTIKLLDQRK